MTNQQGAPEALRLAESLERRTTIWAEKCFAALELRRLHYENERLAALVEAQQPTTHVPNPAEIEHVAGDVSKNGAESDMAQQPAPSAAAASAVSDGQRALHKAILNRLSHAELLEKAHYLMGLNSNQARTIGELQDLLKAAPQPSPTPQAASSAVLKAIRAANMQLVRTGDDEFMLVTYKNAKAQCDGGKCGIGGYCDDCPTPQADSQPAKVPTSATGGDWTQPTTVALRLGDAMQLLCGGKRPPDDMVQQWLDNTSESLQEFAASNGPAWAQGIGLIDAALVMVDQPTEIRTIDNPDRDHEHRAARKQGGA